MVYQNMLGKCSLGRLQTTTQTLIRVHRPGEKFKLFKKVWLVSNYVWKKSKGIIKQI